MMGPSTILRRVSTVPQSLPNPQQITITPKTPPNSNNQNEKFLCPFEQTDPRYVIYKQLVYSYSAPLRKSFPDLPKNQIRKMIFQMFLNLPQNYYQPLWNDYISKIPFNRPTSDASCYSSEYEESVDEYYSSSSNEEEEEDSFESDE